MKKQQLWPLQCRHIRLAFVILQCLLQIDREQFILIVTHKLARFQHLFDYGEYFMNIKTKMPPG